MADQNFFKERTEQSRVKAELVGNYFFAWAKVLKSAVLQRRDKRLAYIDLFSGPGRYEDGTDSVPLMILKNAITDPFLRNHLVTVFNDKVADFTETLETEIAAIQGVENLRFRPEVMNEEVGSNIARVLEQSKRHPTFLFADPWGYRGLSIQLLSSVFQNWGCECFFFFNYNRINAAINNPNVDDHMNALFGIERANLLRRKLTGLSPAMRESTIIEEISSALGIMGGKFVLPFFFKDQGGSRTTHYLIFVTKNPRGFEIMKDVMARASSHHDQGVASFSFIPDDQQSSLQFEIFRPLNELAETLLNEFAGRTMTRKEIYETHQVGTLFTESNYRDALLKLEEEGRIVTEPAASDRRANTFAPNVSVRFPRRDGNGE